MFRAFRYRVAGDTLHCIGLNDKRSQALKKGTLVDDQGLWGTYTLKGQSVVRK